MVLVIVSVFAFGACSAEDDARDSGEAANSANQGNEFNTDARLTLSDSAGVENLDPDIVDSIWVQRPMWLVYDRLLHFSPAGELEPGLASDWEQVDDTTLRLQLREGVTFHDGEEFNADAVVANFDRSARLDSAASSVQDAAQLIGQVEVLGPYEIEISLQRPSSSFPFSLAANLGAMISPAALDNDDLDIAPVGSGMYEFVEFDPNSRLLVERYEDYWDPEAVKLGEVEMLIQPDAETRSSAVRAGEVDLTFVEPRQVPVIEETDLKMIMADKLTTFVVVQNFERAQLGNVQVRRAIRHALNTGAIAEQLTFGTGVPTAQPYPPGYPGYNEDYPADYYEYDPERARQLLAEAGHSDGIELSLLVLNREQDRQLAEVLQQQLGQANITLDLQVVDPGRFQIFFDGEIDMFLGRWGGRVDPRETLFQLFAEGGFNNPAGVTSPDMAEAIQAVQTTPITNEEERWSHVRRAAGLSVVEARHIMLFSQQVPYVMSQCVEGFEPSVSGVDEYRGIEVRPGC